MGITSANLAKIIYSNDLFKNLPFINSKFKTTVKNLEDSKKMCNGEYYMQIVCNSTSEQTNLINYLRSKEIYLLDLEMRPNTVEVKWKDSYIKPKLQKHIKKSNQLVDNNKVNSHIEKRRSRKKETTI